MPAQIAYEGRHFVMLQTCLGRFIEEETHHRPQLTSLSSFPSPCRPVQFPCGRPPRRPFDSLPAGLFPKLFRNASGKLPRLPRDRTFGFVGSCNLVIDGPTTARLPGRRPMPTGVAQGGKVSQRIAYVGPRLARIAGIGRRGHEPAPGPTFSGSWRRIIQAAFRFEPHLAMSQTLTGQEFMSFSASLLRHIS
jgi:hypothetical protein